MALRIPAAAWSRPIGLGLDPAPRPRVAMPMVDDGPWGGVPIGGLGAGSLGRTQRGDFARRHLRVGSHRFAPGGVDGFALWVSDRGDGRPSAVVLRTTEPPAGWGPGLAVGSGSYRALFPRGWFAYDLPDLPVRVLEEQLTPVIPGDDAAACLPVGAFEYELENRSDRPVDVAVLLAFADPLDEALGDAGEAAEAGGAGEPSAARSFRAGGAEGVALDRPGASFAVAAATDPRVAVTTGRGSAADDGATLWAAFAADGRLAGPVTAASPGRPIAAVAARITLAPGETRSLRFALGWDLPIVEFGGGRRWWKRYTREWGTGGDCAPELAAHALSQQATWRAAIEAWQAPILAAADRPDWYKAALFNELYFLVDGGTFWPDRPLQPDVETARAAEIGFLECVDYPFYNTLDVHFYAAFALSALWPRLEVSISRAYATTVEIDDRSEIRVQASGETALRKVAGALPHDLGGPLEDPLIRVNHYAFQEVNGWKDLGPKFVLQAWRDRTFADDADAYLRDVWPAVRRAMAHVAAFDRDGDGLPEHDGRPDQTYDTWPMSGPSAYGGSLWLAALRAAAAMARAVGEEGCAVAWDADFERAAASFQARLWNGRSFDFDGGGGPSSDSVMADQLVGQWYADACGLGDLVPAEQADSALRRIHELNVLDFGDGLLGAVNGMRPDGSVDRSSEQSEEVWVGTTYALAAFMIGRGLVDEGWTTAAGAARVVWERGLWFRTPEAYDRHGNFRAALYLRPLAIWAIEEALARRAG